jgi:thiol-disulfide isomerase/thioredoxin
VICSGSWAQQKETQKVGDSSAPSPAAKKLLENSDDVQAYIAYQSEILSAVARNMQADPEVARSKLDEAAVVIADLKPSSPTAKTRLTSLKSLTDLYRAQIDVQKVPITDLEKQLADNPDDAKAITGYFTKLQLETRSLLRTQPDAAAKLLDAGEAALAKARQSATSEAAKKQLATLGNATITSLQRTLEVSRMSLAELGTKLTGDANNVQLVSEFYTKVMNETSAAVRTNPAEAAKKIEEATAILDKLAETTTNASVKSMVTNYKRTIESMSRSASAGAKLTEMIGKDAAPLKAEAWVNGAPLTNADLKGKVVFLDFWAVWCGPCIATFPHLREWNEKYADKGLVMIGLTNYYNFKWDEDAKKAARASEKITPAQEQEMLVKFAESYELKHRFAIESGRSLSQYYGVTGIPHVVIIDQEGKIRLMKVGSGEANAKEIGELLGELLDSKAAGGQ